MPLAYLGFIVTIVVFFTRLFSDLTAISGVGGTLADWGRLIASTNSTSPTQFFLLATLLYEILAIAFAIFAANRTNAIVPSALPWSFFVGWFTAALLIFSFTSGRSPEQAVHTALPLVLLGGAGLGDLVSALDLNRLSRNRIGALFAAMVGLVIAVIAFVVLIDRTNDAIDRNPRGLPSHCRCGTRGRTPCLRRLHLVARTKNHGTVSQGRIGRASNPRRIPRCLHSSLFNPLELFQCERWSRITCPENVDWFSQCISDSIDQTLA